MSPFLHKDSIADTFSQVEFIRTESLLVLMLYHQSIKEPTLYLLKTYSVSSGNGGCKLWSNGNS